MCWALTVNPTLSTIAAPDWSSNSIEYTRVDIYEPRGGKQTSFFGVTEPDDEPHELAPLVREAIALVVRLTSGEATSADAEDIRRWRAQSREHEEAFRTAARLWKRLGTAAKNSVAAASPVAVSSLITNRRLFLGGGAIAVVAAAGAYMVVRPPLELWPSYKELMADYRTSKGEQRQVTPSPGISVELGTLTSLAVQSNSEADARLELIEGEAAIKAQRPRTAPLVLTAGDVRITASQASFDTRCVGGIVSVTCLDGRIDAAASQQNATLGAGQQVSYTNAGLGTVTAADIDKATSWRSGRLTFRDVSLASVVEEVNRYRPGKIIITNDTLARRVVNATVRSNEIDSFISQIEQLFGAKATSLPAGVLLLS
jgi:transmembrane sensor